MGTVLPQTHHISVNKAPPLQAQNYTQTHMSYPMHLSQPSSDAPAISRQLAHRLWVLFPPCFDQSAEPGPLWAWLPHLLLRECNQQRAPSLPALLPLCSSVLRPTVRVQPSPARGPCSQCEAPGPILGVGACLIALGVLASSPLPGSFYHLFLLPSPPSLHTGSYLQRIYLRLWD